ncbi:hypothetical protein GJAV_G00009310 [Gymnothorax javanicus]|nr:hypothetical protein GJAV_G00009310 [Gymnothorax javanicus]
MVDFSQFATAFYFSVLILIGQRWELCGGTVIISTVGANVTLPCGTNVHRSCSAVHWKFRERFIFFEHLVQFGKVIDLRNRGERLRVGPDCSLHISNLSSGDGGQYTCDDAAISANTTLQLLNITVTPNSGLIARKIIALDCYLSVSTGLVFCNHTDTSIRWVSETGAELRGERYQTSHLSPCHSKLTVELTRTDHNRQWRCQLVKGKEVKTTLSYVTKLKDGIEEVFAVVGGSVALPCTDISPPGAGEIVQWSAGEKALITLAQDNAVTPLASGMNQDYMMMPDLSLMIKSVITADSGYYQCSLLNGSDIISTKRILLHILKVNGDHIGDLNFTLTCSLTCAETCDKNMNLTWSHNGEGCQERGAAIHANNTLISELFVPKLQVREKIVCIVLKEGTERARQEWAVQVHHALPIIVSCVFLLILLFCIVGVGMYLKKKQEPDNGSVYANFNEWNNMALYEECAVPTHRRERDLEGEQSKAMNTIYALQSAVNQ